MSSSRPRSNGRSNGAAPPPQANGNAFVDAPMRGPPTFAPPADLASPAGASSMGPAMPYPAHASSSYAPSARGNGAAPGSAAAGGPRSLNRSGSLRLDSLRHFAGLLVAEKPLDAHRQYQRAHTDGAGTPRTPPTAAAAAPAAAHVPAPTRAPEAPLEAIEVSDNAEYEAFRRKFKTGRLYTVVRNQIMKNKRRRGRAGYLEHLKGLYNGIVPSSGRTAPRPLPPARRALSLAYLACMLAFDFATPLLLTVNASLVTAFLAVCVTFASLFAAGLYPAWLVETQLRLADVERAAALEAVRADVAGGEKLWGPQRLWRRYVRAGDAFGGDLYMAEWGAVGAAVVDASGEAWRYIASTFVHISFKHFIILGIAFMVSAALVERRYGMLRTTAMAAMFAVTGSMAAVLARPPCSVTFGASPLAWGFLVWWAVDTAAKLTLYPWRNPTKLRKTFLLFKNLSNHLLLLATALLLLIGEVSLGVSSAAAGAAAAASALLISPLFCPRWSRSRFEAISVPLAIVGVLVFWVIIPLAGAGKVSGAAEAGACPLTALIDAGPLPPVTVAPPLPPPETVVEEPALETEAAPGFASVPLLAGVSAVLHAASRRVSL